MTSTPLSPRWIARCAISRTSSTKTSSKWYAASQVARQLDLRKTAGRYSRRLLGPSQRSTEPDNISTIIDGRRFRDTSELDGFFSGFDEKSRSYKYDSWQYQGEAVPSTVAEHYVNTAESFAEKTKRMDKGRRRPTPACSIHIASTRYCGGITPPIPPKWSSAAPVARGRSLSRSRRPWRATRAANAPA